MRCLQLWEPRATDSQVERPFILPPQKKRKKKKNVFTPHVAESPGFEPYIDRKFSMARRTIETVCYCQVPSL